MVFDEKYCVRWHDGKISYHTIKELMTNPKYNRLERFGMIQHPVLRSTYGLDTAWDRSRNGILHHGLVYQYRHQVYVKPDPMWLRNFGYYSTVHYAVYEGIIYDGLDRPMDPKAIVAAYDATYTHKKKKQKDRGRWNSRDYGRKLSAYGHRGNRRVRRNMEIYLLGKHHTKSWVVDELKELYWPRPAEEDHIHPFEQTTEDEMWEHVPVPKVRRTGVIGSFYRFEAWWDAKPRDVEKSWKYQSKRKHQWKG